MSKNSRTDQICARMLGQHGITPVLMDVGASGESFPAWDSLAPQSIYIGFDPDSRDLQEISGGRYLKSTIVNQAVTAAPTAGQIQFFLTRSPHCSSTLRPDQKGLAPYIFSDKFEVEREIQVPAATLNDVVERLALSGIDWLKLDTQGTDLRLFQSLRAPVRDKLLAVDVEPGLIDGYLGEDKFTATHEAFQREDFWLSAMRVKGVVRMNRAVLAEARRRRPEIMPGAVETMKPSPGWCECRYLRTVESLVRRGASEREYVLLWIFALLDGHVGFALEVGLQFERQFPGHPRAGTLAKVALGLLQPREPLNLRLRKALPAGLRRLLKDLFK
jgi:FkbM family methyltransferase